MFEFCLAVVKNPAFREPPRGKVINHSAIDCRVTAYTQISAVGAGLIALDDALMARRGGLRRNDYGASAVDTWIGRVALADEVAWNEADGCWISRNNSLAKLGLAQDGFLDSVQEALDRFGLERVGVIVGTSTSSIGRTEEAYAQLEGGRFPPGYRQPLVHNPASASVFVADVTGARGPQLTISTACSSSAKVFASAWRWLATGLADAVLVGGVDSLCHSVISGFNSLELTSPSPCRPFDRCRNGISLGEAAGFALLTRADSAKRDAPRLSGYGESSDAFHMSQPPPGGEGALRAMQAAFERAGLRGEDVGYLNLHGTATRQNDEAEAQAVERLLPGSVHASSTKGWTGHTLGAAGIIEAIICLRVLETGHLPGTLNLEEPDPELKFPVCRENSSSFVRHAMSNSFGFGGNNCSLIFSGQA